MLASQTITVGLLCLFICDVFSYGFTLNSNSANNAVTERTRPSTYNNLLSMMSSKPTQSAFSDINPMRTMLIAQAYKRRMDMLEDLPTFGNYNMMRNTIPQTWQRQLRPQPGPQPGPQPRIPMYQMPSFFPSLRTYQQANRMEAFLPPASGDRNVPLTPAVMQMLGMNPHGHMMNRMGVDQPYGRDRTIGGITVDGSDVSYA